MRELIYVPIVHSVADLGSVAEAVREQFTEAFGAEQWTRRAALIEEMWEGLAQKLLALPLAWERTRLYQDGLPVCGREAEIVRELAAKGSRNHRLLLELMDRGATLMGTEDPELMLAEYRRIQRVVKAAEQHESNSVVEELRRQGEELLQKRDVFLADRIDTTVADGETGLLFIGLLHRAHEILDRRFDVRHVIHHLPFGADPWRRLREREHDE